MSESTPQHEIGSGFCASSTAAEVLDGLDLHGRCVVVTGGYSGIGIEITRTLAARGARVLVPARRRAVAEEALSGDAAGIEITDLDLADLGSVERFADALLARGRSVDMLIANAGIAGCPETRIGAVELQFAVNHLGHFALVNRLLPLLAADCGARVVVVSSRGHKRSPIRFHDLGFREGYDKWLAYGQSKTANVLFAVELDRLARGAGVRAFAVHPGAVRSPLQRHMNHAELVGMGWIDEQGNDVFPFRSAEQGAATAVWAATSRSLDGMGGVYLEDCEIAEITPRDCTTHGVSDYAVDAENARRLWRVSAELTGLDAFSS